MVYLPTDIIYSICEYVGYIPTGVSKSWHNVVHGRTLDTIGDKYGTCISYIESVCRYGTLDEIQYIMSVYDVGYIDYNVILPIAAERGVLHLIKWLVHKCENTYTMYSPHSVVAIHGASKGHLHVVKWVMSGYNDLYCWRMITEYASFYGYIDIVQYVVDMRIDWCISHSIRWASRGGQIHIIKYIIGMYYLLCPDKRYSSVIQPYTNLIVQPIYSDIVRNAAYGGHMDVVEWAMDEGTDYIDTLDVDSGTYTESVLPPLSSQDIDYHLAMGDQLDIISTRRDIHIREIIMGAIAGCSINVCRWLISNGYILWSTMIDMATSYGNGSFIVMAKSI